MCNEEYLWLVDKHKYMDRNFQQQLEFTEALETQWEKWFNKFQKQQNLEGFTQTIVFEWRWKVSYINKDFRVKTYAMSQAIVLLGAWGTTSDFKKMTKKENFAKRCKQDITRAKKMLK